MTSTFTALPSFKVNRRRVPLLALCGSSLGLETIPISSFWFLSERVLWRRDRGCDDAGPVLDDVSRIFCFVRVNDDLLDLWRLTSLVRRKTVAADFGGASFSVENV